MNKHQVLKAAAILGMFGSVLTTGTIAVNAEGIPPETPSEKQTDKQTAGLSDGNSTVPTKKGTQPSSPSSVLDNDGTTSSSSSTTKSSSSEKISEATGKTTTATNPDKKAQQPAATVQQPAKQAKQAAAKANKVKAFHHATAGSKSLKHPVIAKTSRSHKGDAQHKLPTQPTLTKNTDYGTAAATTQHVNVKKIPQTSVNSQGLWQRIMHRLAQLF